MNDRFSRRLLARALYASTALVACPALAQLAPPAPVRQNVDANGINLFDGQYYVNAPVLSLGQDEVQGLSYYKLQRGGGWTDNLVATLNLSGSIMTVSLAGRSDTFTVSGSSYLNTEGNGATLTFNGTSKVYTYTSADGTIIHFNQNYRTQPAEYSNEGRVTDIISPSGAKLTFTYQSQIYCYSWKQLSTGNRCLTTATMYRPASVRNSSGYQMTFGYNYNYDYDPEQPELQPDFYAWSDTTGVTASNLAIASGGTSRSQSWGSVLNNNVLFFQVTDPMSRVTKYRMSGAKVAGVTLPGDTSEAVAIGFSNGRVSTFTTPSGTTNYASSDANGERTITVTDPLNHSTVYKFDIASQRMTSVTDANNHTTAMTYDGNGRIKRVTQHEGNYAEVDYDDRGNVIVQRLVPKANSNLAPIVRTAGYDQTCGNPVKCNQPNWTKDAKGNQTDYTYDDVHGGLLTVTLPAASANEERPQTRYGYTAVQAYFKNASQAIVASGEPVYKLTSTSQCQVPDDVSGPGCAGKVQEVVTTVSYGPQSAGTGNNLLPISISQGAGNGSLTATTAYAYDDVGNLVGVDGPLIGAGDTTRSIYNANRELVGSIDPDPDSIGSGLKNRALRTTIDPRGLATKQELGVTDGQSDAAFAGFVPAQAVDIGYDASRRVVTRKLSAGGQDYALTQTSYLADDSLECTAVRMNIGAFGSLPSSACALGTEGGDGPDRITKVTYDPAGQPTKLTVALGTDAQADERTIAYTANGIAATLTDGEGNRTDTFHDGFDRLGAMFYPSTNKGSGTTNYSDKIEFAFDENDNLVAYRNRAGALTQFSYDNLNRLTTKDRPGTEPDISYSYDLMSRLTGASQPGNALTFGYDALSRQTDEVGPLGTVSQGYDLAGRRTLLTTSNGFHLEYSRLTTGELSQIRDGASNQLMTYVFDDLRRRREAHPIYGEVTTYTYDPISRLSKVKHDLASTENDVEISLGYNAASQIKARELSNDIFASAFSNANVAYASDGLNRYTSVAGTAPTYDANGNVTFDPTNGKTYGYDSENELTSASGGVTLGYDPLGRLYQVSAASGTRRFLYASGESGLPENIAEVDGSGGFAGFTAFGGGVDEPALWWQPNGSGGANVRTLHADERGSVIAVADANAVPTGINRYDEYGVPQSVIGRFGFTGQAWLPELGLQYSRARMYSPRLGRFSHADPIGQADDPNVYQYGLNDPVNNIDPTGFGVCPLGWNASFSGGSTTSGRDSDPIVITSNYICLEIPNVTEALTYATPGTEGGGSGGSTTNSSVVCPVVPKNRPIGKTGLAGAALLDPTGMIMAAEVRRLAIDASKSAFPTLQSGGSAQDAYRHFYGAFALTKLVGPQRAMSILNANEVSGHNAAADRNMDTFNNYVAVKMAQDPRNAGKATADLASAALASGCLTVNK